MWISESLSASVNRDRAAWADQWFGRFRPLHAVFDENRKDSQRNVKIAILDTGIDFSHTEFQQYGIKAHNCKGFPESLDPLRDRSGHGTHGASVLLKTALPQTQLFVARVADDYGRITPDKDYEAVVNVSSLISF